MPDGSLRISTRIDNSKIDKDIVTLENKIKKLKLNNSKNKLQQDNLQDEINRYDGLCNKADEYRYKIKELNKEKANISKQPIKSVKNVEEYQEVQKQIKEINQKYDETVQKIDKQSPKIEKAKIKLEEVKQKQIENNHKINEYNKKIEEGNKKQLKLNNTTEGISKPLNSGMKKILKYAMTLLSIRSVYSLLSNAMNSWLNGNSKGAKQIKADIDYMKNTIGGALSPILKYIVNLLYQALGFTGALIKVFTGIDIFAGSVAGYMSSTVTSASKTNKELRKQLTSFDKANKLESNNLNSAGGSSGNGTVPPSQDLSNVMGKYIEQAEKIKGIFENIKDYVVAIGIGIATWKVASSILEFLSSLGIISKSNAIKMGISIGLMVGGAYLYYNGTKRIINGSLEPKDLLESISGSAVTAVGAGLMFGSTFGIILGITLLGFVLQRYTANMEEELIKKICEETGLDYGEYKNKGFFDQLYFKFQLGLEILGFKEFTNSYTKNIREYILEKLVSIGDFISENIPGIIHTSWTKVLDGIYAVLDSELGKYITGLLKALDGMWGGVISAIQPLLKVSLEKLLLEVANWVEKIPIIGTSIADGIRQGVKNSQTDMTETLENTTSNSIENAKEKANQKAGSQNGTTWMTKMQEQMNSQVGNLQKTIEQTVAEASVNSEQYTGNQGEILGNNYAQSAKNSIQNSRENLSKTLRRITTEVSNETIPVAQDGGRRVGNENINGIKSGQESQRNSLHINLNSVVREANNNVDISSSKTIGSNIIGGINSGINNNSSSLSRTMTNLGSRLLNTFKKALGIHSPSKEMALLSKYIPLGIANGIDSTSDKAISSMKNLVTDIEETVSDMNIQYNIPKIPKNAISYVPRQAISTKEIQRSIIGNSDILDKILNDTQTKQNREYTFNVPIIVDGETLYTIIQKRKEKDLFVTNGG